MKIEIDQSGRVEYTSTSTTLADSVGNSIVVRSTNKQYMQKVYREAQKPRMYVLEIFSLMMAFLISETYSSTMQNTYIIDSEYIGREQEIKTYLFRFLKRLNCPLKPDMVTFGHIGKKSKAHMYAYASYKDRSKATIELSIEKMLRFLP